MGVGAAGEGGSTMAKTAPLAEGGSRGRGREGDGRLLTASRPADEESP